VTGIRPREIALTDFCLRGDDGHPRVLKVLGDRECSRWKIRKCSLFHARSLFIHPGGDGRLLARRTVTNRGMEL
jgi:hypothetical protein